MSKPTNESKDLFNQLKDQLAMIDPVAFVEKYLTLDGEPFRLHGNGYKPFADIYRYIGIKALEPNALPVILVKGRQVGGTTMAGALEMYFMGSGLFGVGSRPPIRVIHAFPLLELAAAYSKTKLNQMISTSARLEDDDKKNSAGKIKSYMQGLLDPTSPTNDSLHFKQFVGGNHIWIESTGIDADRLMGRMLSLDTDLPTPTGFVKLKDLKEGDQLFDEKGNICNVTKLHPIDLQPESYKITFDDGTMIDACKDHLWLTYTKSNRNKKTKPTVKSTFEIFNSLNDIHSILMESKFAKYGHIFISNIEKIEPIPMRCITVDSVSHLFLITKKYIPTHNTADVIFFDECEFGDQYVESNNTSFQIKDLYNNYINGKELPLLKTFNELTEKFEYKKIIRVYHKGNRNVLQINADGKYIYCTPNHKHLTYDGWKRADELKYGDLLKSSRIDKLKSLNSDQEQIVIGSFLGDGNLMCQRNIKQSSFRLRVIHGINQEDYCKWKASMFNCNTAIIEKNGYSNKKAIKFVTPTFGLPIKLTSKKQNCPQWILDKLDARGIAIWFMDDGSITRKWKNNCSATISTCSFDEDSQIRFVKKFNSLGIDCHYKKYDGYFYLLFNKDGFKHIVNIIKPYIHESMAYKINEDNIKSDYKWNSQYNSYTYMVVRGLIDICEKKEVYDIEMEDNHNFIISANNKNIFGGPIVHNCQRTTGLAMGNALKILTTAKYGKPSKGVQVYFGTPRRKGSDFHKMWMSSSQQYYYLGCEKCGEHFPLYTPGSDEWESIWLYDYIVKCPHCGFEQDKREAAERGKWVALKDHNSEDCKMIGFHINQLYMPTFKKSDLENEKPGKHPINTERIYHTEVLGEFFQGDTSPITPEEIAEHCGDAGRKFKARINPGEEQMVVLGLDYGLRADIEQLANPEKVKVAGQSYSTAVVLVAKGPGLLSIEFATKFKRNDLESKKGIIDQIMRQYSIQLAVGDIGFSQEISETLHTIYGDRYIVSRARGKVNNYVNYLKDAFPKEISFERDFYIRELYEQMKKGQIRFPYGDYEKIAWLIDHCASMEVKPSISKTGSDPVIHYVKGSTPNDGFMALLNAYLGYKFLVTSGFTNNNPLLQQQNFKDQNKPLILTGFVPRRF